MSTPGAGRNLSFAINPVLSNFTKKFNFFLDLGIDNVY